MDKCKHVDKFNLTFNHSVLDPQKWYCHACGATDTIWACLSCPDVACGILSKGHSFKHFKETKHALTLEVNDQSVYCYECGDCVYNDNAASDLKVLGSALGAITTHSFLKHEQCNKRLLRSSYQRQLTEKSLRNHKHKNSSPRSNSPNDKLDTAVWHGRQRILRKVFRAWKALVLKLNAKPKAVAVSEPKVKMPSCADHNKTLIPGVTGLRNLGNTCYMNSILQVLGHLDKFRHFFVNMPFPLVTGSCGSSHLASCLHNLHHSNSSGAINSAANCRNFNNHINNRNNSAECFQRYSPRGGGLNGGATHQRSVHQKLLSISQTMEPKLLRPEKKRVSLCEELRALFQVLWSGNWPVVSPNALLQAVWNYIPVFRGYSQQDAQEFLSQLLEKVQTELGGLCYMKNYGDVVADTFQGELVSEVTCRSCGHNCRTYEKFMDLSLEFPARYQRNCPHGKIASNVCHITEMLSHFTKPEYLEGKVYACDSCNSKRKRSNSSPKIYTEIKKQFMLSKLPHILRLHLKRFRWSKGNHREKIATHVSFENFLNMKPFCLPSTHSEQTQFLYKLSAIIIHHGQGFGSGHYTAFCWSKEANSWVHCNDTRVQKVSMKDVFKSQVYILIFSLHSTGDHLSDSCSLPRTIRNNSINNDNRVPYNDAAPSPIPNHEPTTLSNTHNSSATNIIPDTIKTPIMTASPNIIHDTRLNSTTPIKTAVPTSPKSYMNMNSMTTSKDKGANSTPFVLLRTSPRKTVDCLHTSPRKSIDCLRTSPKKSVDCLRTSPRKSVDCLRTSPRKSVACLRTSPKKSVDCLLTSPKKSVDCLLTSPKKSVDCPRTSPRKSVDCPRTSPRKSVDCLRTSPRKSVDCLRTSPRKSVDCLRTSPRKSVDCLRTSPRKSVDCLRTSPRKSVDCLRTSPRKLVECPRTSPRKSVDCLRTPSKMSTTCHARTPPKKSIDCLVLTSTRKSATCLHTPPKKSPDCLVHTPPKRSTDCLLQRLGLSSHVGNTYETRSKLPRLRSSVVQKKSIVPQIFSPVDRKRKSDQTQNMMGKTKRHRITI